MDLNDKINETRSAFVAAERKTTGELLQEPPDEEQKKKDAKKGKESKPLPVDFESMLKQMKSEISRIYSTHIGQGEVYGKSPVALLDEIEQNLMNMMAQIKKMRSKDQLSL